MRLEISYADVSRNYPEIVNSIIEKIRNGKSKAKNDPPESFKWYYDCQAGRIKYSLDKSSSIQKIRVGIIITKNKSCWRSCKLLPTLPTIVFDAQRSHDSER